MGDVIAIARQNVELFNRKDWDAYREIQTPDATYEETATQRRLDREGGIDAARGWSAAFPDSQGTITNGLEHTSKAKVTRFAHAELYPGARGQAAPV